MKLIVFRLLTLGTEYACLKAVPQVTAIVPVFLDFKRQAFGFNAGLHRGGEPDHLDGCRDVEPPAESD